MSSLDRRTFLKTTAASLAVVPAARGLLPSSDDDPLGVRADFPVTETHTYLNTASVGPLPKQVRDAGVAYLDENMREPFAARRADTRDEARTRFAALFGAKPEEVAMLYSTSDGENIVANALDLRSGDNVVIDELHFTTTFVLYRALEKQKGIELRIVAQKNGRADIEDFDARIDGRTKLVSVAWVSNRNGYLENVRGLAELAHAKGTLLFADGVQALGHFPTSLREEGVDFVSCNSYKWLFSSFGAAPFFVREEHLDRVRPDRYGHGTAAEDLPHYQFEMHETARKYEYASAAFGTVYQLNAALEYLRSVGLDRIRNHTVALAQELRQGLVGLGFDTWTPAKNDSPIVSFAHGRDPREVRALLDEEGIVVTFREDGESVIRVGVALFNNRADVQKLLKTLARVA
ncbi:MAG TPA: aminotransferase class V-fold PLP-dependent enzyme [Vicinamibacteria bacterium]|nr:aminotransferase class V-fold PLP-dependent enzyme [Vicinamibacteria bacterium]